MALLFFYRPAQFLHKIDSRKLKRWVDQWSLLFGKFTDIWLPHDLIQIDFYLLIPSVPDHRIHSYGEKQSIHSREIFFFILHSHKQDLLFQFFLTEFLYALFLCKKPYLVIKCLFTASHIRKLRYLRVCHIDILPALNFLHCLFYTYSHFIFLSQHRKITLPVTSRSSDTLFCQEFRNSFH